jgi:hypothetical protein
MFRGDWAVASAKWFRPAEAFVHRTALELVKRAEAGDTVEFLDQLVRRAHDDECRSHLVSSLQSVQRLDVGVDFGLDLEDFFGHGDCLVTDVGEHLQRRPPALQVMSLEFQPALSKSIRLRVSGGVTIYCHPAGCSEANCGGLS